MRTLVVFFYVVKDALWIREA